MRKLAHCVLCNKVLEMRKCLDISLTVVVTAVLTITMLWPLEAQPQRRRGATSSYTSLPSRLLPSHWPALVRLGLLPVFIGASAFIELIQPTFNRSAELSDWVADTLSMLIGIGLGLAYRARQAAPVLRGACPL